MTDIFDSDERTNNLRNEILMRHVSSVMTDSERAKLFGLDSTCRMREGSKIIMPENLKCGKYNWIGEGVLLDASGGLEIGDFNCIGLYNCIFTHTSYMQQKNSKTCISDEHIIRKSTKIGSRVFFGAHVVVYHGVTIGDDAIILPMAAVNRDVPAGSIYGGVIVDKLTKLNDKIKDLEKKYADLYKMYLRQ